MDQLRQRIRHLNFISDGSFSGSIAKLPIPVLSALIADLIPVDQRVAVRKQLKPQGMITAVVGQLGKRAAGSAGERVAEQIGDNVADFFSEGASTFFDWVTGAPLEKSDSIINLFSDDLFLQVLKAYQCNILSHFLWLHKFFYYQRPTAFVARRC